MFKKFLQQRPQRHAVQYGTGSATERFLCGLVGVTLTETGLETGGLMGFNCSLVLSKKKHQNFFMYLCA